MGAEEDEGEEAAGAAEELPPGDEGDEETLRGLGERQLEQLWALRRLLVSAPPALESLRLPLGLREVSLAGGRVTCVDMDPDEASEIPFTAAALLPWLASTGQRLPLLKVGPKASVTCWGAGVWAPRVVLDQHLQHPSGK